MRPGCSIVGGADADKRLAAVVGTDMRGDNISGAPNGVVGVRICCAVRPCIPGDNSRDSAADCANRRHSSSQAKICESATIANEDKKKEKKNEDTTIN